MRTSCGTRPVAAQRGNGLGMEAVEPLSSWSGSWWKSSRRSTWVSWA